MGWIFEPDCIKGDRIMETVVVRIRNVNGINRAYPSSSMAQLLAGISKSKTLSRRVLDECRNYDINAVRVEFMGGASHVITLQELNSLE